jgi:hypothetical protein
MITQFLSYCTINEVSLVTDIHINFKMCESQSTVRQERVALCEATNIARGMPMKCECQTHEDRVKSEDV